LIMHTQAYSCLLELLPRNPNFYLFVLLLLSYVVLFSFFSMFLHFQSFCFT